MLTPDVAVNFACSVLRTTFCPSESCWAVDAAAQLAGGQDVVLKTLQQKMSSTSGVNIDEEMAHLLSLQNAYSANARVMSTVNEMYKTLMQAM